MVDHVIRSLLQDNHEKLLNQYENAQADLVAILQTLNEHILPHLSLELGLQETDAVWLREWLDDTASVFRLLRRHQFTRSFTLEAIRSLLLWRLRVLRPAILNNYPFPKLFHCLPPPASDPLGRPIVFIKVAALCHDSEIWNVRDALLRQVERLRLHLKSIRDLPHCRREHEGFPLQYIALVDLGGVSIQNMNFELVSWLVKDVVPHFPGMFAAVFLLNYSWTHSGVWSVAKRVLPESTISRVFFPSRNTLLEYCSASTLPAEYGGSLPPLDQIEDPLRDSEYAHIPSPLSGTGTTTSFPAPPTILHLAPTSSQNPYFGYPVTHQHPTLPLPLPLRLFPHRRKRDLVRTLAVLYWRRWGSWRPWTKAKVKMVMMIVIACTIAMAMAMAIDGWTGMSLFRARVAFAFVFGRRRGRVLRRDALSLVGLRAQMKDAMTRLLKMPMVGHRWPMSIAAATIMGLVCGFDGMREQRQ
ncbi:CRAL-TRIO domain-containing protein [Phlebopus sp. FC_14]|nr:CRAL-TRIO domain-containing protein [Phlebopus sp. FC_14]